MPFFLGYLSRPIVFVLPLTFHKGVLIVAFMLSITGKFMLSTFIPIFHASILKNNFIKIPTDGTIRDYFGYPGRNLIETLIKKYNSSSGIFISDKVFSFSYLQNKASREALEYFGKTILSCSDRCDSDFMTPILQKHQKQWRIEHKNLPEGFPDGVPNGLPEVFYFHHGLRFQPENIKNYVRQKDILDIGAFIGDSAVVLAKYTDKKIYSYEISKNYVEQIKNVTKKFKIDNKVEVFLKGLGRKPGKLKIIDEKNIGQRLRKTDDPDAYEIEITSIDNEVQQHNITVGFIKADVEGVGMEVMNGAIETIKRDRPVIELAVYHSFEEFFGFVDFILGLDNYLFEFHNENDYALTFHEIAIFAYPAELVYPKY